MKKAFFSWIVVTILTLSACVASPATSVSPTPTAVLSVSTGTSPAPTPLAPTPTQASLPSFNLLYSSGPQDAAFVGGNISLFQTSSHDTPSLVIGKDKMITCWIPSPDGSKVLYVPAFYFSPLNDFVNVIDLRTRQVRQTAWRSTNRCMGLIWHPSGGAFLGSNYEANQLELYGLGEQAPLAAIGETGLSAFSMDGKILAIFIGPEIHFYDIVLDAAGQVAGVSQEYTSLILPLDNASSEDFRWSPDGTKLAVLNQRAHTGSGPNPTELYVFDLADQGLVKAADSENLLPDIQMMILPGFAWSPDGSKIAFSAYTATEAAGMAYYVTLPQVFVTGADGSGLVEITTRLGEVGEAVQWSPDGTKLIFVAGTERPSTQDVPVYIHDHLTMSNPDGSDKSVLPIQDFFVLEGPIIDAPFMVLPPDSELPDLLKKPIDLNCASGWTQLESGSEAVVAPGAPNRVRTEPEKGDNLITEIQTGTVVKVLKGPVCADGLVFWRVQSDSIPGGQGWTAEGDGNEYYLEPIQ